MNFNKVIIAGNLTRDPQLSHLPSGAAVAEMGMAINRKWRSQSGESKEEVCFVDVLAYGKQAETVNQYFNKGKPILVEGRLKFNSWEGKDGKRMSKLYVVMESFSFVGGKSGDSGNGQHRGTAPAAQSERYEGDGWADAATAPPGDDIPF